MSQETVTVLHTLLAVAEPTPLIDRPLVVALVALTVGVLVEVGRRRWAAARSLRTEQSHKLVQQSDDIGEIKVALVGRAATAFEPAQPGLIQVVRELAAAQADVSTVRTDMAALRAEQSKTTGEVHRIKIQMDSLSDDIVKFEQAAQQASRDRDAMWLAMQDALRAHLPDDHQLLQPHETALSNAGGATTLIADQHSGGIS